MIITCLDRGTWRKPYYVDASALGSASVIIADSLSQEVVRGSDNMTQDYGILQTT